MKILDNMIEMYKSEMEKALAMTSTTGRCLIQCITAI